MQLLKLSSIILISLAATLILAHTSRGASGYDDLIDKITTKTMINHFQDYHGKSCGSPTDDYAPKWLYTFQQKHYFARPNDDEQHDEAVRSLRRAMSSENGAYAVVYIQNSGSDPSSTPSMAQIYWTENDKNSFTTTFTEGEQGRILHVTRKGNDTSKRLRSVTIGDPSQGKYCQQEFMNISLGTVTGFSINEYSHPKLLVSTFDVTYPNNYTGKPVPSKDPATDWQPTGTRYDKTMQKIITHNLSGYGSDEYGYICNSPANDYKDKWLDAFEKPPAQSSIDHKRYVDSLHRAMTHGAYAIVYNPSIFPGTSGFNWQRPEVRVLWTENKADYEMLFSGEEMERTFTIRRRRYEENSAPLYRATLTPPGLVHINNSCDMRIVSVSDRYNLPDLQLAEWSYAYKKLFKTTFAVRYPIGYKGLPAPGNPTKLDYLALGDSFSSGEGDTEKNHATNQKYYRQFTDVKEDKTRGIPKEKCHVSTRSYPYKLARQMGLTQTGTKQWDTVACSGATIYDMNGDSSAGYEGQDFPLGRLNGLANKDTLKGVSLNEMIPGRVKQIEFVKKYQPKVITLTAGGNDVGFGDKLKACVPFPSTCVYAKTEERRKLKNEILNQFERLKSFYEELKSATDNKAKIYVLGYPQFINGAPDALCGGRGLLYLDAREREMITNSVTYLNSVIRQAARAAGVKYIDTENAFGSHWLCGDRENHVNPLLLNEMIVSRIPDFQIPPVELQESFHPNAKGHADIARRFSEELGGVSPLNYEICSGGATSCPDDSATKDKIPEPPYFKVANEQEDIKFTHHQLTDGTATKVEKKSIPIKTSQRPFKPRKIVYVKIYSEPRDLGEIETDENGEIDGRVTLPEDLPAGYHTLVVSGEAPDGTKQELYQTILIKGSNPEDIDENGTLDKNQPCGAFIQAANKDEDLDTIDDACDPEITHPILYTARNGNIELGEDEDRIYLFRNTRASELTGVTNDYVDKSKNQNNTNALVGYTLDEETRGLAFEKLIIMEEDDTNISITKGTPIILAKDINDKCYALKPEDYLSPALKPGSKDYKPRGLTKLNTLPKGAKCEE